MAVHASLISTPFNTLRRLATGLILASALVACEQSPPTESSLLLSDARITLPPPGAPMAAGYFRLHNGGKEALVLRGVSSPAFGSVQMHETQTVDGMSRMREVTEFDLPAGADLVFEPGGAHLMLEDPGQPLVSGQAIPLDFKLVNPSGESVTLSGRFDLVGSPAAEATADDPHAGHHH